MLDLLIFSLKKTPDSYTVVEMKAGGRKIYVCIKDHLNYMGYKYPGKMPASAKYCFWPMKTLYHTQLLPVKATLSILQTTRSHACLLLASSPRHVPLHKDSSGALIGSV